MVCKSVHATYGVLLTHENAAIQSIADFRFPLQSIQLNQEAIKVMTLPI